MWFFAVSGVVACVFRTWFFAVVMARFCRFGTCVFVVYIDLCVSEVCACGHKRVLSVRGAAAVICKGGAATVTC